MSATTSFDNDIAAKYGVNEAILLNNFQYWVRLNKHNKSEQHYHHGKFWTYQTQEALRALFPYWSLSTIQRTLKSMVEQGLIIAEQLKKSQHDRTTWYTLTDEMWQFFDGSKMTDSTTSSVNNRTCQNDVIDGSKMTDSEHVKMTCSYLNNHNQSLHTDITPLTPQGAVNNVNTTPVPVNRISPDLKSVPDDIREYAWRQWQQLIVDHGLEFTKRELSALKAFAYSHSRMQPHEIKATLTMVYGWAVNDALDIADALTRSLNTRTIVQATMRKESDSKGQRIYDINQLNWIRERLIADERGAA